MATVEWLLCEHWAGTLAFVVALVTTWFVARSDKREDANPQKERRNERPRRVLQTVFGAMAVVILIVVDRIETERQWLWWLAFLPASLIIHHGIQLAVFKNRRFFDEPEQIDQMQMDAIVKAAIKEEQQYYGTASLALRFALPALVLTLANLVVGYLLAKPPDWLITRLSAEFVAGAHLGTIGAYLYVILFLGGRAIRSDITTSSVWWCVVTISGGPLLAGALPVLFPELKPGNGDAWAPQLLPFAAGFSMRFIVDFVNDTIRRVFGKLPEGSARRVPLGQLRGITQEIEERMAEEGISDVANLAMANAAKLRRHTRFDKRQILAWIDEALLLTYLPTVWQALEADGITGAVDLIWYADDLERADLTKFSMESKQITPSFAPVEQLAKRNKIDPAALAATILRMKSDAQVCLIRALYQLDDTERLEGDPRFLGFLPEIVENGRPGLANEERAGGEDAAAAVAAALDAAPASGAVPAAASAAVASAASVGANVPVAKSVARFDSTAALIAPAAASAANAPTPAAVPSSANEKQASRSSFPIAAPVTHGLSLTHVWRKSEVAGQVADIIIHVIQHTERGPLSSGTILCVEYDLGAKVCTMPLPKTNAIGAFSFSCSLRVPQQCLARITFSDGQPPLVLERYLSFEVAAAPSPTWRRSASMPGSPSAAA